MKKRCPLCGNRKAQRRCKREEMAEICSLCCVEKRDEICEGCTHYTTARKYQAARRSPARLPDGHFIAELNPEVEQAVNDALELAQRGKTDPAWESMQRLLRQHPGNHTVCFGMGTLHANGGDHRDAIKWFDKAIAIFPYFVEAHFNKAAAYQKQLDVGNAIRSYRKVVEVGDPGETTVKQAQSFLDSMAEVIQKNEGVDLDAYLESHDEFNRAFALMEKGDWLSALAGFRACAAKTDRHAPTHGNMGICFAKLGRKAEALAELDRALEIDPDYEPAITNRVLVERIEEGKPMDFAPFAKIEYGKERFVRQSTMLRSLLGRLSRLLPRFR